MILVMTDDQGYGDVGFHGNEMIQTPNLDALAKVSVRLNNFHVDPTCAETRSALMTGRYSTRVGVWHTIMGRSLLPTEETTMAEVFAAAGYRTGMFGKWHLGDNYPMRPEDQGFQKVFRHGGGGVGQTPDYFGNDYFDDTYFRNLKTEPVDGYCSDVWFDNALSFIESNKDRPFFCYIATNAPHGPYNVDEKYSDPYVEKGVAGKMAKFYGMITNIDDNMAKLRGRLSEWGLAENTILVFTTDNGTAAGASAGRGAKAEWPGFNAGMRGQKGSQYEGGHRTPCFIHWPAGNMNKGKSIDHLAAHIDLLPTFASMCNLETKADLKWDGSPLFDSEGNQLRLEPRTLIVNSQRVDIPQKWRKCSVMTDQWRLVDGKELYDIVKDPGQKNDVAGANGEVVALLRKEYENWWNGISGRFDKYVRIPVGDEHANPALLTCHDWHAGNVPWNQNHIKSGLFANGPWMISVTRGGRYRVSLRRWPAEKPGPIEAVKAKLQVGEIVVEKEIDPAKHVIEFELELPAGKAELQSWLTNKAGKTRGAYYAEVERLP